MEEEDAFEELKHRVTTAPILQHPDPTLLYLLETDASDFAYGAILSQRAPEDGRLHPVAFLSKSMTTAERNYGVSDKELLAIVKSLGQWRQYLQGTKEPIKILTDHKNLETLADIR